MWEAHSNNEFYTLNGHKGAITAVAWRADSNVLATASEVYGPAVHHSTDLVQWTQYEAGPRYPEGSDFKLSSLHGKKVLLIAWASW